MGESQIERCISFEAGEKGLRGICRGNFISMHPNSIPLVCSAYDTILHVTQFEAVDINNFPFNNFPSVAVVADVIPDVANLVHSCRV